MTDDQYQDVNEYADEAVLAKAPPADITAETALLGSILLDNRVMKKALLEISAEHFYLEKHRTIFEAMHRLWSTGTPIDAVTIVSDLKDAGTYERMGGAMTLAQLTDQVSTVVHAPAYAKRIRHKAAARNVVYTALEIANEGFEGVADIDEYLATARARMTEASSGLVSLDGPKKIDDLLTVAYNDVASGKLPEGVAPTGIANLDFTTSGLWPGLLTVLAGRPGMGKSAFVLNVAINVAKSGRKVLYITMEDTRYFVVLRLLARFADVDLQGLMSRNLSPDGLARLVQGMVPLTNQPFWVDDTSGITSTQIAARVANFKEQHGLDLLVVDHLGEVTDTAESETAAISRAARNFRDLAKELHIPVLLASQLNRKVEDRPDKRPRLADLRQSGTIEQMARFVWFLYRPGYYSGDEDAKDVQLIVAKASHGKTGTIRLFAELSRMFIRAWDTDTDGPFPSDNAPVSDTTQPPASEPRRAPWSPSAGQHEREDY